jgi:hypothetical protein
MITNTIHTQTDMNFNDLKIIEENLKRLQRISDEKDIELNRINDQIK